MAYTYLKVCIVNMFKYQGRCSRLEGGERVRERGGKEGEGGERREREEERGERRERREGKEERKDGER